MQRDHVCWAGLAAYPSWLPTLQRLADPKEPPCAFTDFCEEAALRAAEACAASFGAATSGALSHSMSPWIQAPYTYGTAWGAGGAA